MNRPWRIVIALCILAAAASAGTASYLQGQIAPVRQFPAIPSTSCDQAPAGASMTCQTCLRIFCATMDQQKAQATCKNYCAPGITSSSPAVFSSWSSRMTRSASSRPAAGPVCGNAICEATESQYCPRDCPGTTSSIRPSSAAFSSTVSNPLNLSCSTPLTPGNDSCSSCVRMLCERVSIGQITEAQMIGACTPTCQIYTSRSSSMRSSSATSVQSSTGGEPGGSYIELNTANPQEFQANGDGWITYGIAWMHQNKIAPNDAQATATWQAQLPFGSYDFFMYWPHDRTASERYLMDRVPMFLNLNNRHYSIVLNQRTATPAFSKTIGGAGPETVQHHWYRLGSFQAAEEGGFELPQTVRLWMPTGRASDSVKNPADGWIAAGDVRIYYRKPGIECGDAKCHESERESCAVDCEGVSQCGNGYCDQHLGETLQTCLQDCGAPGVCGNLRCEPYAGENISNCRSDCQTAPPPPPPPGNTGGDGGENPNSSAASSAQPASSSSTQGGLFCGDNKCSGDIGETQENCPQDCGSRSSVKNEPLSSAGFVSSRNSSVVSVGTCGNARCDNGESYDSCPKDCANRCGDGICNPTPGINPGENATNCPADCSYCGDRYCARHESPDSCLQDCPRSSSSYKSSSATSRSSTGPSLPCTVTDPKGVTCVDSDCGAKPNAFGTVSYTLADGTPYYPLGNDYKDICVAGSTTLLAEKVCQQPFNSPSYSYIVLECPHGCRNGACLPSSGLDAITEPPPVRVPAAETLPEPSTEEPAVDVYIEPELPVVEPEQTIDTPNCENRSGGTMCTLCFNAFCPFGTPRAEWLCSLYCVSPELSAMVQPASSEDTTQPIAQDPAKERGFWEWLHNFTASLIARLIGG